MTLHPWRENRIRNYYQTTVASRIISGQFLWSLGIKKDKNQITVFDRHQIQIRVQWYQSPITTCITHIIRGILPFLVHNPPDRSISYIFIFASFWVRPDGNKNQIIRSTQHHRSMNRRGMLLLLLYIPSNHHYHSQWTIEEDCTTEGETQEEEILTVSINSKQTKEHICYSEWKYLEELPLDDDGCGPEEDE